MEIYMNIMSLTAVELGKKIKAKEISVEEAVTAALDAMDALVSAGKIFEVNTGAISRGWRTAPYPSRWALEQLKRRSARVTISSDSHSTDTVDCAFGQAQALLRACGFEEIWAFDGETFRPKKIG